MQSELTKLTVSVKEAAAMLGLSQRTVWSLKEKGKIAVCRIGTRVLFPVKELERFVQEQMQTIETEK
jgi:excisionase family DNA binding protein